MSKLNITVGCLFDPIIDSEEDILAIRAAAMKLAMEGKTIMEYDGEGTSYKRSFTLPIEQVLSETRYALKAKNPKKYGYITKSTRPFFI